MATRGEQSFRFSRNDVVRFRRTRHLTSRELLTSIKMSHYQYRQQISKASGELRKDDLVLKIENRGEPHIIACEICDVDD